MSVNVQILIKLKLKQRTSEKPLTVCLHQKNDDCYSVKKHSVAAKSHRTKQTTDATLIKSGTA